MKKVKVSFGTAEGDKRELNCTKTFTPKFAHLQSPESDIVVNLAGECNVPLISISHCFCNKNHTKTTNKTSVLLLKGNSEKVATCFLSVLIVKSQNS